MSWKCGGGRNKRIYVGSFHPVYMQHAISCHIIKASLQVFTAGVYVDDVSFIESFRHASSFLCRGLILGIFQNRLRRDA